MKFSGERVVPELEDNQELYYEHIARYHFALQHISAKRVLDVGCGTGYGSAFLASHGAEYVTGIDISPEAIEYASENFNLRNLQFEVSDATQLSSMQSHVDVCVSFEVIEHIQNDAEFLRQIHSTLTPAGICILSTPNKQVSSPNTDIPPNPFHVREYTLTHLEQILSKEFKYVSIFGQGYGEGFHISDIMGESTIIGSYQPLGAIPYIPHDGTAHRFNEVGAVRTFEEPLYFVAVCADVPVQLSGMFIGLDGMSTLRRRVNDRESWIRILQTEKFSRDERISDLEDTLSSREAWITLLQTDLRSRDDRIVELEDTVGSRDMWVKILQGDIQRRDERIRDLESTLQARDEWISHLKTEVSQKDEQVCSLQDETYSLRNEITQLMAQVETLHERAERDVREVERMTAELSETKSDALRLEQEVSAQTSRVAELEEKIRELTVEIEEIVATWAGRLAKALVRRGRPW